MYIVTIHGIITGKTQKTHIIPKNIKMAVPEPGRAGRGEQAGEAGEPVERTLKNAGSRRTCRENLKKRGKPEKPERARESRRAGSLRNESLWDIIDRLLRMSRAESRRLTISRRKSLLPLSAEIIYRIRTDDVEAGRQLREIRPVEVLLRIF
ncbi:MAG: hypothetical protein IJH93_02825 [Lachnospiraceae bacterium]|nr:hypothetical protein [Lachnospiraceae bacterium]